ncbi:MAG: metallophosphoesterase [Muribaculaceae bacterium]|nr:metallophosphoesterase [Muribaculaceae bacterium]
MRLPILMMIITILINGVVDYYLFKTIKNRISKSVYAKSYAWLSVFVTLALIVTISLPRRTGTNESLVFIMWMLFTYFSIYIPKYIYIVCDLVANIPLLLKKQRIKWMSKTGTILGVVSFCLVWWGALVNRFNINVNEIDVPISSLPASFDGYRVAQISDLHVGTFGIDTTFLAEVVEKINSLDVDAVMFTGDIVNRNSAELQPFVATLSRINARDGVFSVLGNHDYGDYSDWESPEAKEENLKFMHKLQKQMNWTLLLNETKQVYRGNDSIFIIGVENLGDPPFKNYGSLSNAYTSINDSTIKILLSHNPAHWERDIKDKKDNNIALTLSGHTHAMQMSIGSFSPAALRYKYWGGLYVDDSNHYLNVNVGIGEVALPMRIGATPEITVLTLRKAQ